MANRSYRIRAKTAEQLKAPPIIGGPIMGWGPCWSDTMYGKKPAKKKTSARLAAKEATRG